MPSAFQHHLDEGEFLTRLVKILTVGAVIVAGAYFAFLYLVAR